MKTLFKVLLVLACSPVFAQVNFVDVLNQAQTFAAVKTFPGSDICIIGTSTGVTCFATANSSATNYTITLPAATGTVALTAVTLPSSATTGDLWYASGTNAMAALADVATGSCLQSGGVATAPIWSTCATGSILAQGALPMILPPSGYVTATGIYVAGQAPANSATATFSNTAAATVGGTIATTGVGGQFSYTTGSGLAVGDYIAVSGTLGGTGTITGYTNPTTYYVSAVGAGTFTLQTASQGAIVTTAGSITGLTFTPSVGVIFSAATLLGSASDANRELIVLDTTYKPVAIISNATSSTTVAQVKPSVALSGTGAFANSALWLTGQSYFTTNATTTGYAAQFPVAIANSFMYFPASSAFVTAGLYFCTDIDQWVYQCNTQTYTSGQPAIPGSPTAPSGLTPGAFTQSTATPVLALAGSVAAGTMGVNGEVDIDFTGLANDSATTKGYQALLASSLTPATGTILTTTTSYLTILQNSTRNANLATVQYNSSSWVNGTTGGSSFGNGAQNTANLQYAQINLQIATATDYVILESYSEKEYAH